MKNILEYLEKTVGQYPNKVAFVDEYRESTFIDSQLSAKRIGTKLLSFGSNRAIAVLIDKNCNCIESMLGALYAGDFYIVLDVHSPEERLCNILETLEDAIILTDSKNYELAQKITNNLNIIIYENIIDNVIDDEALRKVRNNMIDMDTAYILFTSGSTGNPKGTVISHRSLISYINWVTDEFGFDYNTSFGSQTPLYFSMSVTDFYSTIKCGCTYNIIPKKYFSFPLKLVQFLDERAINTIYWVPTAIATLTNWKVFDVVKPKYLQTVLFAGEVMPTKQLNYWIDNLENVLFANLFGPTETTDICTFYRVNRKFSDSDSLPIGTHCDNCNVFIVNSDGKEAVVGEEGELYVRSTFMADGYYRNPEKTNEAFVQNPLNDKYPERVYKTGDIVKVNELGEIIYISRKDFQIKRNGYRIELGEIEAGANGVDGVKGCACIFDKELNKLVLIYEGRSKLADKVSEAVRNHVPPYMNPDIILSIKELPKNANGKIDRNNLIKIYKEL